MLYIWQKMKKSLVQLALNPFLYGAISETQISGSRAITTMEQEEGSWEAFFKSYVRTSKLLLSLSSLSFCKRSIKMWNWSSVGFLLFKILINMICLKNQLGEEAAASHKVQNEEAEPVSRPDTWQLIIIQEKKDCHW